MACLHTSIYFGDAVKELYPLVLITMGKYSKTYTIFKQ